MFAIERRWKMARPDYWRDEMGKCSVTLYTPSPWHSLPYRYETRAKADHAASLYRHIAIGAEYNVVAL